MKWYKNTPSGAREEASQDELCQLPTFGDLLEELKRKTFVYSHEFVGELSDDEVLEIHESLGILIAEAGILDRSHTTSVSSSSTTADSSGESVTVTEGRSVGYSRYRPLMEGESENN